MKSRERTVRAEGMASAEGQRWRTRSCVQTVSRSVARMQESQHRGRGQMVPGFIGHGKEFRFSLHMVSH